MRTIRWTTATVVTLAVAASLACGDGNGPSGPNRETRVYAGGAADGSLHVFVIEAEGGLSGTFGCPGTVQLTIEGGSVTGSVTIGACPTVELTEPTTIPIASGSLQGGSLTFTLFQQQAILEGLQTVGCEVVEADDAFDGTSSPASLDVALTATVECDGEQAQGTFDVTWRMQGVASS